MKKTVAKKDNLAAKIQKNRRRNTVTPEGRALDLRVSLAQLVFHVLKMGEATMEELAREAGFSKQKVYRICMADENVSIRDIGTLGHALGVDICLRASQPR